MTARPVTGATRVAGIIGDPVTHSASPLLHNAGYAALDLDRVYLAFEVPAGEGAAAVEAVRTLGLAGVNVTYPHKADAAAACDELSSTAEVLGAVNTVVVRPDGSLYGTSTDGDGFVRALAEEGVAVAGVSALVLGAGGAARAIAEALGRNGAEVVVAARRPDAAAAAARLAPGGRAVDLTDDAAVAGALRAARLVVQATPVGMAGGAGTPAGSTVPIVAVELLAPDAFVAETIYHPAETPLLAAARARGLRGMNGLGMLLHQAVLAFQILTDREISPDILRKALTESARMV